MAKNRGVAGWHTMRKDELVRALVRAGKAGVRHGKSRGPTAKSTNNNRTKKRLRNDRSTNGKLPTKPKNSKIQRQIVAEEQLRDLAQPAGSHSLAKKTWKEPEKDRLVVLVRDPYWLHVYWQITRLSIERAKSALAQNWHGARPYLRLLEVDDASASNMAETVLREIEIHSGVNHWFIDLHNPPGTYRVDIGYRGTDGLFYVVSRSNLVTTPRPGSMDAVDRNWEDVVEDCEKIYARSGGTSEGQKGIEVQEVLEEKLRRPLGSPLVTRYGAGAERSLNRCREFECEVDCELIVFGSTSPDAYVTVAGDPIKLRSDGTFTVRIELPEKRLVIPVVSDSSDGIEQRTTVLAIDRNTKTMEPVTRDPNDFKP